LDYPYSNALFVGAEKTLKPDTYKREKHWAKTGSAYYGNFLEGVNARLIEDTYQILLLFDKVIIKPADFAVNTELHKMKFIEMEYPLLRTGLLESKSQNLKRFLDPLRVSLLKSLKEKVPVPIFAKYNELSTGFTQALEGLSKPEELNVLRGSLRSEKKVLDLVLDRVVPRVKITDFNHLLELREDPNLEPFKEKVWEFVELIKKGPEKEAVKKISKEIDKATKSIKLPSYGTVDRLRAYVSPTLDIAQVEPHIGPFAGIASLIKDFKESIDVTAAAKHRWILFGRTRLRSY
jgi:hypothetical protein